MHIFAAIYTLAHLATRPVPGCLLLLLKIIGEGVGLRGNTWLHGRLRKCVDHHLLAFLNIRNL